MSRDQHGMQYEYKIIVFCANKDTYIADVYLDGKRIHCGDGMEGQPSSEALRTATEWLRNSIERNRHAE